MKVDVKTALIRMAVLYGVYGVIALCQPRLVSDEVAEESEVMECVQAFGDGFVDGCTRMFFAPIEAVKWIKKQIKERIED